MLFYNFFENRFTNLDFMTVQIFQKYICKYSIKVTTTHYFRIYKKM